MKQIQIFRCNQCFDLLYIMHNNNNTTSLVCNIQSHTIKECKEITKLYNYDLICCECGIKLKIFYDNYKCIDCKKFICNHCSEKHYNNCPNSDLIYLYNVGYTCEKHNKKYIDTCDLCNKNLCQKCKLYHFHIIKKEFHVQLDEKEICDSINMNKLKKTKNYIKYHLFKRYIYMKKLNLINIKVNKSLYFLLKIQ